MGENSKIDWTDHSFNPWMGCTKVSPACDNCYAEVDTPSRVFDIKWGPDAPRYHTSAGYWKKPLSWNRKARLNGKRARVFSAPNADVFEGRKDTLEALSRLFKLIEATPNLDWLLLTKRPHNVMKLVPETWRKKFPDNVWIGTTVENQEWADKRIPHLLKIPAKVRFVSAEPLFSPLDISSHLGAGAGKINWVITGGESGKHARGQDEMIDWYRSLRDQCVSSSVPFFFKQWGNFAVDGTQLIQLADKNKFAALDGWAWKQYPDELVPPEVAEAQGVIAKKPKLPKLSKKRAPKLMAPIPHVTAPKPDAAILQLLGVIQTLCQVSGKDVYATVNRGLVELERAAE